jgi:hypothetical protein
MEAELSRRQALALATGALVGSGAFLGSVTESADAATPTVRGSWLIEPSTRGGKPLGFQAVAAFGAGGIFVTTGSDEDGTGLGQWSSEGAAGFAFTYINFHFGRNGKLNNTVKVRAKGTFHGSTLKGEATLTRVDPAGKALAPPSHSKFTGKRIAVEAP